MSDTEPHMNEDEARVPMTSDSEHTSGDTSPIPVIPQLSVALLLLVFVFGVTYIGATNALTTAHVPDVRVETLPAVPQQNIRTKIHTFEDISIEAKSAFVWDVAKQRVLFNKDADESRPLASITKLMTALVAYELLDPSETVAISDRAIKSEGDSGFIDGETFTMQDLADLTLLTSSNDGAVALSAQAGAVLNSDTPEDVFVHAMNVKARELGLSKTRFLNSTGLDISEQEAGAYGSARDVAFLMEHIITHSEDAVALTKMDATKITNDRGEYHTAQNTNTAVNELDGLIASKTGYTLLSGGNLVVAVNVGLNRPIIVAVLGSSYEGRFTDVVNLVEEARQRIIRESE